MNKLHCKIAGVRSPNPFWLASAPPTDKQINVERAFEAGWGGVELNFGCPHGMSERNMGSAVGQVPQYIEDVTGWCKAHTQLPVFVKLTPNIFNIRYPARAAKAGGADAVSLINTINSITGINLDSFAPEPVVAGKGGISSWRDAAECIAMGCGSVQVCTAAMHHGFRIIDDLYDGLSNWMDDQDKCIECGLCHIACEDTSHQAISQHKENGKRTYSVIDDECVGCNLCALVCPVPDCIRMVEVDNGKSYLNWTQHPNNPMRN